MNVSQIAESAARSLELAGIAVICGGVLAAAVMNVARLRSQPLGSLYTPLRQDLARAILLGLEVLVAGDIIGTVAVSPTLNDVAVLAVIVLIRTFLSFSMEVEIEGAWPWQRRGRAGDSRA